MAKKKTTREQILKKLRQSVNHSENIRIALISISTLYGEDNPEYSSAVLLLEDMYKNAEEMLDSFLKNIA